ncbi:MAG: hypothetical protein M1820_009294 [Bogoriella megaspora]|nr:MAG: hypothetical protein M1820_009294 [Bogoriella megaspora]
MAGVATKHEWLIILPDHDDALERRLKVRPEHLQNIKPKVDSDIVTFGGAILEDVPKEGEGLRMNGSVMLVNAASRDEAIGVLKDDVYFKNRVWDWDKLCAASVDPAEHCSAARNTAQGV